MRKFKQQLVRKILTLFVGLNSSLSFAQISQGGLPYSFLIQSNLRSETIDVKLILPKVDKNKLKAKLDSIKNLECKSCRGDYYGTGIDIDLDVKKNGKIIDSTTERKTWLLKICSEEAYGMQFYFDKYKLPKGSKLFFYNEKRDFVLGAFTEQNNMENLRFGTQPMPGSCIYIEYSELNNTNEVAMLHAYKAVHVFERAVVDYLGVSQNCEIDINCTEGANYKDIAKSVAAIYYYNYFNNLAAHCTGTLINTTGTVRKPYLITARHCTTSHIQSENENLYDYGNQKWNESNWVFLFNYQSPGCNDLNQLPWASSTQSVFGANEVIIGDEQDSDYALIEVSRRPELSYDVKYLGWDRTGNIPASVVGIHHPAGDVKKISFSNNIAKWHQEYFDREWHDADLNSKKNVWKVSWYKGITEGGSSGSALIDASSKKIIGVFSNGSSNCSSPSSPDYYAMLNYFWDKGSPPIGYVNPGIFNFLDASGTGYTSFGSELYAAGPTCSDGILNGTETGKDCGGNCKPCTATPTCYDYVKNGTETGVDCGGNCPPCPVPTCSDGWKNQGETAVDCGGPCAPCSTLCNNGKLDGDEFHVDCGGSCTPCLNLVSNGTVEVIKSCADNANVSGIYGSTFDLSTANLNCMKNPSWYTSHGDPLITYGPSLNSNGTISYNYGEAKSYPFVKLQTAYGYLKYAETDSMIINIYGSGVYCQLPFYLEPGVDYKLNFSEKNLFDNTNNGGTNYNVGVYGLQVSIAGGLTQDNVTFIKYNSTAAINNGQKPSYNYNEKMLADWSIPQPSEYINKNGTYWDSHTLSFNVTESNKYNQLWFKAIGVQGSLNRYGSPQVLYRLGVMGIDNVILAQRRACLSNLVLTSSSTLPQNQSSTYIKTNGSIVLGSSYNYYYKASDYVEFNEGFETSFNTEMIAEIGACSAALTQLRLGDEEPAESSNINVLVVGENNGVKAEKLHLGKTSLGKNDLNIYPNPSDGIIYLQQTNGDGAMDEMQGIELLDSNGKLIRKLKNTSTSENETIDMTDLNDGLYLIKILYQNNIRIQKIVIQK